MSRTLVAPALVCLLAAAACTGSGEDRNRADEAREVLSVQPEFVIGAEGDPDYLFGEISSVAGDSHGWTFVADRIAMTVRAFDDSGTFAREIARPGEGPGEVSGWPAGVVVGPEGRLYLRDASRITVFGRNDPGLLPEVVLETWRLPGLGNSFSTRARLGQDGRYHYPAYHFPREGEPRFFYIPFDDGTPQADTVEVPRYPGLAAERSAFVRTGPGGGRMLEGLSRVPFEPVPVWDITSRGTILSSDGNTPMLLETGPTGDTLRTIHLPWLESRPIPREERADSLAALEERLAEVPVPFSQVEGVPESVVQRELPERLPSMIGVHVSDGGLIWIEQWPPEEGPLRRRYSVIDYEGVHVRTVVLDAPLARDPPPHFGSDFVVGVLRDPVTGVGRVARFELPELD